MIGDRWGVTDPEVRRHYACDDLVAEPTLQAWRGVDVAADAGTVWRCVVQIRLAPYSYDWLDNLGRRSPRSLAAVPVPRAGDPFTVALGRPRGRIVSVDADGAERQLTATIMGAFLSYVVVPGDPGPTRLLLKVVARTGRWVAPVLSIGDLVMARRQLLNLGRLAEHEG
ncbi:hypothetical protein GCM10009798_36030 [Nocardioides panacihumi]|uniref:Polyketide cyclase n=1 Tax=Nocardioides panacihumi TaxID=400774 RepID=A0ABN2RMN6_9ACTN